jgi:hypothetical protein
VNSYKKGQRGEGCRPGARRGGGLVVAEGRGQRGLVVEGAQADPSSRGRRRSASSSASGHAAAFTTRRLRRRPPPPSASAAGPVRLRRRPRPPLTQNFAKS